MTTSPPIPPGISSNAVRNIPDKWSQIWFRRFITDHLKNADFRNAIAGTGITITGTEQQQGTISATGGGGGGGNVTPDTHPAIENPANDEFEFGSSIDLTGARFVGATPWTWVNQGTATATVSEGSLVLVGQNIAGVNHNIIEQPTSGATWAYTTKMSASNVGGTSEAGMIVGNAAGAFITFDIYPSGGPTFLIQTFTNPTTFGGSTYISTGSIPGAAGTGWMTWGYLQITYDGTTIFFNFSPNGVPGSFVNIFNTPAATFLTVPTVIGLDIDSTGTNYIAVYDWFRKTA